MDKNDDNKNNDRNGLLRTRRQTKKRHWKIVSTSLSFLIVAILTFLYYGINIWYYHGQVFFYNAGTSTSTTTSTKTTTTPTSTSTSTSTSESSSTIEDFGILPATQISHHVQPQPQVQPQVQPSITLPSSLANKNLTFDIIIGPQQKDGIGKTLIYYGFWEEQVGMPSNHQQKITQTVDSTSTSTSSTSSTYRLVVPIDHQVMYWFHGQEGLCQVLDQIKKIVSKHIDSTTPSKTSSISIATPLIRAAMDCEKWAKATSLGQGNWVTAIYSVRLAVARYGMDFELVCTESSIQKSLSNLLTPWYQGYFIAPRNVVSWPYDFPKGILLPRVGAVCSSKYKRSQVNRMLQAIIDDTRQMALNYAGVPPGRNDILQWWQRHQQKQAQHDEGYMPRQENSILHVQSSIFSSMKQMPFMEQQRRQQQQFNKINNDNGTINVDHDDGYPKNDNTFIWDDVVIHFRCGDYLGGVKRSDFRLIRFNVYRDYIKFNETKSIGIVTQPFARNHSRSQDASRTEQCRQVIHLLVSYLQNYTYPDTVISIRNTPNNETLPLAYTRLVYAKQAFTSVTSFAIFPVLATFGDGYFQRGNEGVNPWANAINTSTSTTLTPSPPNLHRMEADEISAFVITQMQFEDVLNFFITDDDKRNYIGKRKKRIKKNKDQNVQPPISPPQKKE